MQRQGTILRKRAGNAAGLTSPERQVTIAC